MTTIINNQMPHPVMIEAHLQDGKIESQTISAEYPYIPANGTAQIVSSGRMVVSGGVFAYFEHDGTTIKFEHADPFSGDNEHMSHIDGLKADEYLITSEGHGLDDHPVVTYTIHPASAADIA
jgi:hypothetical protein